MSLPLESVSVESVSERPTALSQAVVSPRPSGAASAAHFQSIDGLRGLACLAVVFSHCYMFAGKGTWPLGLPLLLSRGYLGVEVFFVLSGFCLAYPILSHPERPDDWKQYARRRAWRILPAYWAAVLLFALAGAAIRRFHVEPLASSDLLLIPSARQCLYTVFLLGVNFNPSFWTLVLEARWYFVFPVLILLRRRLHNAGLFLATCGVTAGYLLLQQHRPSERLVFLTGHLLDFLPLFALGIVSAHLLTQPHSPLSRRITPAVCRAGLLLALVLVGLFVPVHAAPQMEYARLVPGGLLALFLLLGALHDPAMRRVFAWKPLAGVGLFSYSLYLLHQPIIMLLYCITGPLHWNPAAHFFFYYGFVSALCVGMAYLFYCVAERPFLRKKQQNA